MLQNNPLLVQAVIACPYEVGDILQTKNAALPSERWPGTEWAAIETFLLGASTEHTMGSIGGEETHTLTEQELPNINGKLAGVAYNGYGENITGPFHETTFSSPTGQRTLFGSTVSGAYGMTFHIGGDESHNNMPPYTAVYIWERIA